MKRASFLALSMLAGGCAAPQQTPAADTLIFNGTIYLGAPDWRAVEALLVRDGRVVAAGAADELIQSGSSTLACIDLRGHVALPGLQDAHGHVEGLGEALEIVDLRGAPSLAEVVRRVAERASVTPRGTWVKGRGWDQNLWPDKAFPAHGELSLAVPDHPVLLERVDGHALLANRAAMALAGVERAFENELEIPGGRVLLDAERRPTGVFVDAATALVERALPPVDREQRRQRFLRAQRRLLELGLTAVHDMGISRATAELLAEMRAAGQLEIRLIEYLSGGAEIDADDVAGFPWPPDERDQLCVIGVKLYADGALGSRGAALLEPYSDEPSHTGLALLTPDQLRRAVALCSDHGLQPAVHAIGDAANRAVLDAVEAQLARTPGLATLRPRIEHAQVVAPSDWPRFERLGVIASMQPTHATSDMPWAPARLGARRIEGAYAWRRLGKGPSELAFGSDFPVESPDPLLGLHAAITCQSSPGQPPDGFRPDQRLDARETLTAFTWGAARATRQEDRRGRLLPGYAADLTVLDIDPLRCAPDELLRARVTQTLINGRVVYRAP
jgi:hypothetical protein